MLRSRAIFAFCLFASIALHAAAFVGLQHWSGTFGRATQQAQIVEFIAPSLPRDADPEIALGAADGAGNAVNQSADAGVQTALKSTQDQAALTKDPEGNGPVTLASAAPRPQPLSEPILAPPPQPLPMLPVTHAAAPYKPVDREPTQSPQTPQKPIEQAAPPKPAVTGGRPLQHTDADSDLFAREVSAQYKRGAVTAQKGRQIKFSRPRDNLAAIVDGAVLSFPVQLRMRLQIDDAGHVRNVAILHSTGSISVDRVFELAAYDSWFEPLKDKTGRPMGDEFDFSMTLD